MTKYKKYYVGENPYQWEVKLVIYQNEDEYKFVLADDKDNIYIASNYVNSALADALEETINVIMHNPAVIVRNPAVIMHNPAQYKSLIDIYNMLQNTFYGQFFYLGKKIAPQLTDVILLLSLADGGFTL